LLLSIKLFKIFKTFKNPNCININLNKKIKNLIKVY